jgi:uncharacterized membrane-anchored protein YhcB (DUF1043 family)
MKLEDPFAGDFIDAGEKDLALHKLDLDNLRDELLAKFAEAEDIVGDMDAYKDVKFKDVKEHMVRAYAGLTPEQVDRVS